MGVPPHRALALALLSGFLLGSLRVVAVEGEPLAAVHAFGRTEYLQANMRPPTPTRNWPGHPCAAGAVGDGLAGPDSAWTAMAGSGTWLIGPVAHSCRPGISTSGRSWGWTIAATRCTTCRPRGLARPLGEPGLGGDERDRPHKQAVMPSSMACRPRRRPSGQSTPSPSRPRPHRTQHRCRGLPPPSRLSSKATTTAPSCSAPAALRQPWSTCCAPSAST